MLPSTPSARAIRSDRRPLANAVPRLAAALAALALVLGASTLAAAPALADDTDGISGSPSGETGADTRSRFSYEVAPGQQILDYYEVSNTGTTPQVMKIYGTDAYNTEDGSYGLLETGAAPSDAGSWFGFINGAAEVDLPLEPGTSQVVPFSVTVPADAAPGDHAAGIVISVATPDGQIVVDRRVATRVYVRVPGELQPALSISSIAADYNGEVNPLDGTTDITFTVTNAGNVALSADMVAGVKTYFGIGAGELSRQELSEMLPGATRTITMTVPGVAQLGYLNPYVTLQPRVDADAMDPGALDQVNRDTVAFAVPWLLLAALVLAALVWGFLRIRRVRDEKTAREWIAYTQAEARRAALEESAPVASNEPR